MSSVALAGNQPSNPVSRGFGNLGRRLGWGALLAPVAALYMTIWGVHAGTLTLLAAALAMSIAIPIIAADLLPLAMVYLGLHWLLYALVRTQEVPSFRLMNKALAISLVQQRTFDITKTPAGTFVSFKPFKVTPVPILTYTDVVGPSHTVSPWTTGTGLTVAAGVALILAGGWLIPRTIGVHTGLMRRNGELATRVSRLTEARGTAVDTAAAELRRVERDLHDGAQARLVALGISLRATERLIRTNPDAAAAMVAEARENSAKALADLRGLVRGINPPVLAERGLGDAIRALALDAPMPVLADIDLPGRPPAPVETAVYFAVAETLVNAVKHASAHTVNIWIEHRGGMLRVEVADDGDGGADPGNGTGLAGIERRLSTCDGVLAVSSPPGGPTIIAIEVPCALSLPKIYSC
jgi:signal transduction histidine kinase